MAEMNRINSFKSFSEIKSVEKTNKLREENQAKRKQLSQKFESLLDELGITSYEGLDEETKKSFLSKLLGEELSEGNAFSDAVRKAKEAGEKEFEFEGETYKVEEGNAFIFAAAKAKQEGKDSFEFNGKNYKVTLKKDTGLKESYQLLITEATRWQFGIIDKTGKIESNYVHHDGYPSAVVPEIKRMKASEVRQILKDAEMGGMSSLGKFYNDSKESTAIKGQVKNIKNYLKEVVDDAGAEYVYLFDERIGKWVGADTYTDKALKPVDQIEESVVTEAKAWEIGKDYPSYGVVVGIRQNGDLCEVSFDSGNKIVFRDTGSKWVQESKVTESHFKVGDKVKMSHGATGVIVSLDKEDGAEDEKYYNVELPNGEIHKHSPNELTNEAAMDIKFDPEMTKDYENVLSFAKKYGIPVVVAMATVASMGIAASIALFKKGAKEVKAWIDSKNESVVTEGKDSALQDYVNATSQKTFKGGGNGQNLLDGAMELANHIDNYRQGRDTRGYEEDGFYGPLTITAFKKLVDQMSADDIKNNQADKYESVVTEGRVKQFEMDLENMIKEIKRGYGWIDPEFVEDTWENSSDSIDFELVKGEIYKRLIAAKLLAYADDEDEESAGQYIKSLKELGIKESLVTENSKIDYVTITSDLFTADNNWWVKNKLRVSDSISKALDGCKTKHVVIDIDKIHESVVTEAKSFSQSELESMAQVIADAISNVDKTKAKVVNFEMLDTPGRIAGFYIHKETNKAGAPSRYWITDSGEVVMAFRYDVFGPKKGTIAKVGDKLADVVKTFKANESVVTEASLSGIEFGNDDDIHPTKHKPLTMSLKKNNVKMEVEKEEGMHGYPEVKLTGKRKDIEKVLADIWGPDSIEDYEDYFESVVTEAEIKSDDEFKEYAMTVLKKAFGSDFDEAKAGEVANGILKQADGDYGAAVGMLTSSLGESVVTEGFDAKYWEDYHEGASKIKNPGGMQLQQIVSGCVEDWNDNNEDGADNEVTTAGEKKVLKLAKEFVKATGWISDDVIDAMIAQES
jgi:hypothetical protein